MAKKKDESNEEVVQHDKIVAAPIVREMRDSYLDYAMSVIVSRALPDVRDGLKPVHRRILFAMNNLGLNSSAKFRKSATVVGEVIGNFHPHGDSSIYDAMVKMAQDFYMRYPLVWGQGNFGSIDGDAAAAMRYTEAKMSKLAGELLRDIEKDTVNFAPNFDATKKEPTVLPSRVPNLLLNGTVGIAVGMASKIPPHNLGELLDALIHICDNEDATTEDVMQFIKGPDFPTGGMIFDQKAIMQASASGRGGVVMRGEAEIVEGKSGSFQIIITSLPYQVNKADLIKAIADKVRDKQLEGIRDIRDESTADIRVVIELKQGAFPQKVLNYLYRYTQLEQTFNYNLVALVDGVPRTLSVKGVLEEFLKHRFEVVTRRSKFDLAKAKAREHILLGLKKALDHIDEIIKIIKASKDTPTAHANLMKKFKFSELQASAILDMKLQRLAGLERKKIEDELKEIQKLITYLEGLLKSKKKMLGVIKDEFIEVKDAYADDRRTKVIKHGVKEIKPEDLVAEEENVLVLTSGGYIKRTSPSEYRAQRRGGVGVVDLNVKEEDFIVSFLTANTHDDMLFFSDKGKAYKTKMYELPEGKRATRGKSVMNFLQLEAEERISSILPMPKDKKAKDTFLLMITKQGVVKKVAAEKFNDVRRNGLIAINLGKDDELYAARLIEKGQTVVIATRDGQSIHFAEKDARAMGRTAAGVRAIKLRKGDEVVGVDVVADPKDSQVMVMSAKGYGKRTKLSEYKVQGRGGSGIKTANVTDKTGELVIGRITTSEHEELIAISKQGQVIRTKIEEIPTLSRATQGVRIMKLKSGDSIASLTLL